jgi:hypothetical protein
MPTFRLVGAQIKTVKAEMSKSRPKGSPALTPEQKFWRNEAQTWYTAAVGIYTRVEQATVMGTTGLDSPQNRLDLCEASEKAYFAQMDFRKAHPSDAVEIVVVKL